MKCKRKQFGFTVVELMLSIAILIVLTALAAPMFGNGEALQLDVAKRLLISDLEYTQILAITYPDDEVALILNEDNNGWLIATVSDPSTPLNDNITGEPLLTLFGEGAAASADSVLVETNLVDNAIVFGSNGGLADFTQAAEVTLQSGNTTTLVQISPTTGSIR